MTRASKQALLDAFDSLTKVLYGRPSSRPPPHSSHGGGRGCDACGGSEASLHHAESCPVSRASHELAKLLPRHEDREAWLAQP